MNDRLTCNKVSFLAIILAAIIVIILILGLSVVDQVQKQRAQVADMIEPTLTAQFLEVRYQKGIGYMNLGRWPEAQKELEFIFEIDPNYKDVQSKLVEVYEAMAELNPVLTPMATLAPPSKAMPSNEILSPNNLIAYYPLNGNADDESGNKHHGVIFGNPQTIAGVQGQALQFDGDDYIQVPNAFDFQPGEDDYSIAVWVRYRAGSTGHRVVAIDEGPASFRWVQISGDPLKDDIRFGLKSGSNPAQTVAFYSPIQDGQWHFIVGVREKIHEVRLYIDGRLVDQNINANLGFVETFSDDPIYIGRDPSYEGFYNDGDIDELRIYRRALSQEEILALADVATP